MHGYSAGAPEDRSVDDGDSRRYPMKQRLKERGPFALLSGLIVGFGYRYADPVAWQYACICVAAITAASGPEIVGWVRARRSRRREIARSSASN